MLVAGGLAGCSKGQPTAQASTAPVTSPTASSSSSPTATATSSESSVLPLLGPTGYGALKLGMTRTLAQATGLTTGTTTSGTGACGGAGDGYLAGSPTSGSDELAGRLFFSSATRGLVAIYARPGVMTPQGIGLESTYTQVHAAFPSWHGIESDTSGRGAVAVPGNSHAHYRIVVQDAKVIQLSLDSNDQDCYE
jgi:hypothetical protein